MTQQIRPQQPRSLQPSPGLRIGDAERDRICQELSEHYAAGRLSVGEFNDRSELAVAATTSLDLARLTHDLPPLNAPPMGGQRVALTPVRAPNQAPADLARAVAISVFGFTSMMAIVCTVLLLAVLGVGSSSAFGGAALVAFGTFVGTLGLCYFVPRMVSIRRD